MGDEYWLMDELMNVEFEPKEVLTMSPLTWAYVGDCVYELYVRTHLVSTTHLKPHKLHVEAIKYVKAGAQAEILNRIYDDLSEEENTEDNFQYPDDPISDLDQLMANNKKNN